MCTAVAEVRDQMEDLLPRDVPAAVRRLVRLVRLVRQVAVRLTLACSSGSRHETAHATLVRDRPFAVQEAATHAAQVEVDKRVLEHASSPTGGTISACQTSASTHSLWSTSQLHVGLQ